MKVLLAVAVAAIASTPGSIVQLPGTAGCVTQSGASGCAKGRAVANPFALAVSPDGRTLYAAGDVGSKGAVAVFARDRATGRLTQLKGRAGCLFRISSHVCGTGRGLETPAAIAVSRDGKLVVTAAKNGRAIGLYRRALGGALRAAGCFQTRAGRGCSEAPGLNGAAALAFSPNGKLLVVAGARLSVFRYARGSLTPLASVPADGSAVAVVFSRDGRLVYAVGGGGRNGFITVFGVSASGTLTKFACFGQGAAAPTCPRALALEQAASVTAVAPDLVYVASAVSNAVAVFEHDRSGHFGEVTYVKKPELAGATGIATSADGKQVYVATRSHVVDFACLEAGLAEECAVTPRGLSPLRAIAVAGRNIYAAGHGVGTFRLS